MIAAFEDFGAAAGSVFVTLPAAVVIAPGAINALRALLAVSSALARVRRVALRALALGKSPQAVAPLLNTQAALEQTQAALAHTVTKMLQGSAWEMGPDTEAI